MIGSKYDRVYSRYEEVDSRQEQHARNIEDLNLLYLKGLRDLAQNDAREAAALYGVTEKAAEEIAECSVDELQGLAIGCVVIFRLQSKDKLFSRSDAKSRMAQLARIIR